MSVCHWGQELSHSLLPEKYPIREVLETMHQPTSFKLTLPPGSKMRMTRWASGTPAHFLIHARGVIHIIKDMGLNTKFKEAMEAVETATLDLDIAKMAYK